jgi:hypothetical protein
LAALANPAMAGTAIAGTGIIGDDLTFRLKAWPGHVAIDATPIASAMKSPQWSVSAIYLDGVDVIDTGIDVGARRDIQGLDIRLTGRLTHVTGNVQNANGEPQSDYVVLVFSEDRGKWNPRSRYTKLLRRDQGGAFTVAGLPTGRIARSRSRIWKKANNRMPICSVVFSRTPRRCRWPTAGARRSVSPSGPPRTSGLPRLIQSRGDDDVHAERAELAEKAEKNPQRVCSAPSGRRTSEFTGLLN